eukprot:68155_1
MSDLECKNCGAHYFDSEYYKKHVKKCKKPIPKLVVQNSETDETQQLLSKTFKPLFTNPFKYMNVVESCFFIFEWLINTFCVRIALPIAEIVFLCLYFDNYGPCPENIQWMLLTKFIWAIIYNMTMFIDPTTKTIPIWLILSFIVLTAIYCIYIIAWVIWTTIEYNKDDWITLGCTNNRYVHLWKFIQIEIIIGWIIGGNVVYVLGKMLINSNHVHRCLERCFN